jgi:type I restriction enzyme, S subunit
MEVRPGCKQTEVGVFPEDWKPKPISKFSAFVTKGATPTTYGFQWENDGVVFLRSECVSDHGLDLAQAMFISSYAHAALVRGEVHSGDILMTITGNVGRVVQLSPDFGYANVNQHIARIRVTDQEVNPRFVYHFLSQPRIRAYYASITTGQAYPQISLTQVRETQVPLPPLPEQRAIARALEDVDALIGGLERLIAKKRDLKQAAMEQLLTGQTRLPGFNGEWEVKRLEGFAAIRNQKVMPANVHPDTVCIELEHIGQGDGRLLECSTTSSSISSKYQFVAGDVLFGRLRPYLRKFWLADRDGLCSTELWPFMVDPEQATCDFLHKVVQTDGFIKAASASYGTHMPRGDWDVLRNFEIGLPPVPEQTAIASVLSDMDAEIEALEQRLAKTRALKQGMMQELLTGKTRLV